MNLSLENNVNKFVLLVVIGVIVLLIVNMNKEQLGNTASTIISIVVIVVCGYFGYVLLNDEQEQFDINPYLTDSPAEPFYGAHGPHGSHGNNGDHDEPFYGAHGNNEVHGESDEIENYFNYDEHEETENVNTNPNNNENDVNTNVIENANPNPNANNLNADNLNADNLLPGDTNSTWAKVNVSGDGGIMTQGLLNSTFHLGVDTQGCSLRNSNRGLRSEPPNPQVQVSPWLNTTICPDQLRKPLDCPY